MEFEQRIRIGSRDLWMTDPIRASSEAYSRVDLLLQHAHPCPSLGELRWIGIALNVRSGIERRMQSVKSVRHHLLHPPMGGSTVVAVKNLLSEVYKTMAGQLVCIIKLGPVRCVDASRLLR
jgi:hypothetical protein